MTKNSRDTLGKRWMAGYVRELLPMILTFIIAASLVYISFLPDLPKVESVGETAHQVGSPNYQELPVSNPQIVIVSTPSTSAGEAPPSYAETSLSGILNTIVLLVPVILGVSGLYILFKHRRRLVRYVLGGAFGLIVIVSIGFFVGETSVMMKSTAGLYLESWHVTLLSGAISFPSSMLVVRSAISRNASGRARRTSLMLVGLLASALLAAMVPSFIIFPLLIGISLYDLYSVRRGPVKKIVEIEEALDYLVAYETRGWSLGLGDVVFLSTLTSSSLTYIMTHVPRFAFYSSSPLVGLLTPWMVFAVVATSVIVGSMETLNHLEDEKPMPGLPVPVFLGGVALGSSVLALQLVNYFVWGWFAPIF